MANARKSRLLGGISLAAALMIPAGAAMAADPPPDPFASWVSPMSAYAEVYGGHSWLDGNAIANNEDDEFPFLGGSARLHISGAPFFDFQFDFDGEKGFVSNSTNDSYGGGVQFGTHVLLNTGQMLHGADNNFKVGVFGGLGTGDPEDNNSSTGRDAPFYFGGVEGLWQMDAIQLIGQVGFVNSEHPRAYEVLDEAVFGRAVGRWFFSNYTYVQGEFAYFDGENDSDTGTDDVDVMMWGARLEHQFSMFQPVDGAIISGFAEYRGMDVDDSGGANGEFTDHSVLFGIKVAFNQPDVRTLLTQGPATSLPNFVRAVTEVVYTD